MQLAINTIRTDGGTQPRETINFLLVSEYAESMGEGDTFPAITVFHDGTDYWLADGFHRLAAAKQLGLAEINADVRQGTLQDAQWHSYSANQSHGLRRSNEDKRRAVEAALRHPYAIKYSNVQIAKHCGVAESTIRNYRSDLETTSQIAKSDVRIGADGRAINTANIGKNTWFLDNPATTPPEMLPINHQYHPSNIATLDDDEEDVLTPYEQSIAEQYEREAAIRHQRMGVVVYSSESNEWYTPAWVTARAADAMGSIDLDPASNKVAQAVINADAWCGLDHDDPDRRNGLAIEWHGNVWLNPPYGRSEDGHNAQLWSRKLVAEWQAGRVTAGVLLVKAALGYNWFEELWRELPVCFLRERLSFVRPDGTDEGQSKQATALFYVGNNVDRFRSVFAPFGRVILPDSEGVA